MDEEKPKRETELERINRENKEANDERLAKISANKQEADEYLIKEITKADYESIITSNYLSALNDLDNKLRASNEVIIPKERASLYFDNVFSAIVFAICLRVTEYFDESKNKLSVGSVIQALLINRIAVEAYGCIYRLSTQLNNFEKLLLKFMHTIWPELNFQTIGERTKLYINELNDISLNSTRIPQSLLYHLYTNPYLQKNNDECDWPNDIGQLLKFLVCHATNSTSLNALFKHYAAMKPFIFEQLDDEIELKKLEIISIQLLDFGKVNYPQSPPVFGLKSESPTQFEFLIWTKANTRYHISQFPYLERAKKENLILADERILIEHKLNWELAQAKTFDDLRSSIENYEDRLHNLEEVIWELENCDEEQEEAEQ